MLWEGGKITDKYKNISFSIILTTLALIKQTTENSLCSNPPNAPVACRNSFAQITEYH